MHVYLRTMTEPPRNRRYRERETSSIGTRCYALKDEKQRPPSVYNEAQQCWPLANNVNHGVERACRTQPTRNTRTSRISRKPRIFLSAVKRFYPRAKPPSTLFRLTGPPTVRFREPFQSFRRELNTLLIRRHRRRRYLSASGRFSRGLGGKGAIPNIVER